MNPPEEHDPAWQLLLKSKRQAPSDFFVRNVVREARKLGVDGQLSGWIAFVSWCKRPLVAVPLATGAIAVLITALTFVQIPPPSSNVNASLAGTTVDESTATPSGEPGVGGASAAAYDPAATIAENLERIDYLGELVAVSDPGELNDAALANLLALK